MEEFEEITFHEARIEQNILITDDLTFSKFQREDYYIIRNQAVEEVTRLLTFYLKWHNQLRYRRVLKYLGLSKLEVIARLNLPDNISYDQVAEGDLFAIPNNELIYQAVKLENNQITTNSGLVVAVEDAWKLN